jgi:glycine/D-amino acid oxidase-like deaminating enzyme
MRAHAALRDEFGELPWWHGGGSMDWAATDAERAAQAHKVERLLAWDYAAEWITREQLHELEPDIDLAAVGDAAIAFFPEEGWLDPIVYLHAMLRAAHQHGATVRTNAHVERVLCSGGRVEGVVLRGGERLAADVVVNCTGRWADQLEVADRPALRLPLAPTLGILVFTPPVAIGVRRIVRSPVIHLRPDGAGRLMLVEDADATITPATAPNPRLPMAEAMLRRAATILNGLGQIAPEAVRIGIRAIPADGVSAVGPMPGVDGYYVVVTHSGVTLSPFLAHAVARELVLGAVEPRLEPFRPGRFLALQATGTGQTSSSVTPMARPT